MLRQQHALHVHGPAGARRPRVDRGLQVDVLERRQFAADDGVGGGLGAEEVGDQGSDGVRLPDSWSLSWIQLRKVLKAAANSRASASEAWSGMRPG